MRLMRMHANRESRVRPELFEARGLFRFLRVAALEDHHHALEAGVLRARDHLIQILRERLIREMAMTINHVAMVACRASTAFGSPIVLSNYLATTGDTEDRRFKPVSKRNFSSASSVSSVVESLRSLSGMGEFPRLQATPSGGLRYDGRPCARRGGPPIQCIRCTTISCSSRSIASRCCAATWGARCAT